MGYIQQNKPNNGAHLYLCFMINNQWGASKTQIPVYKIVWFRRQGFLDVMNIKEIVA